MKKLYIAIAVFAGFLLLKDGPDTNPKNSTIERPETHTLFVLMQNDATVEESEQEAALNVAHHFLQQLIDLQRRKATRDVEINIVLTSRPNRITWSGTPAKLMADTELVKELIAFKQTFSDLTLAMQQISTTINLTNPDVVDLYWLGSGIHVPYEDTSTDIQVEVPKELPAEMPLPAFSDRLSTFRLYGINENQDEVVLEYMRNIGVISRANSGELDFRLLGPAQSRGSIDNLL